MWLSGFEQRIFVALGAVDMRKAINGLSILVESELEGNLFAGDMFIFSNRTRTIVKVLYWDRSGFCLWQKKLEKSRFIWPEEEADVLEIGTHELTWLVEGLDIGQAHERLDYQTVV